ncbi:GxxExxY protein [Candidatus Uabimicrobium amorphum]|uniref:GxxExxY protein n=1 Tax=Uabimicrobium amorphum TaxID=2596890 RepID=A0A5S9F6G5_UABAM|nr:GxxExxY protein [Candidatus Uabimicrobium amorphum]BBM86584.1 hypothetical protein UABAM_04970 [Candidatus Uabimicrobium amorphum]
MNNITGDIIGCAIEVHRNLGPGLLESVYEKCLAKEFFIRGVSFHQQKQLLVDYKGLKIDNCEFRVDFLVAECVIVEIKAVERVIPVHHAQVISYMKLSGCKLGLLINFNVTQLIKGVKRFIL